MTPHSILAVSQSFRDPREGQGVERIGKLDNLDDQNPQAKLIKLSKVGLLIINLLKPLGTVNLTRKGTPEIAEEAHPPKYENQF